MNMTERTVGVITKSLLNPGPNLVVFNEGHLLKTLFNEMNLISTERRVVLTDDSLRNSSLRRHSMFQFIGKNKGKFQFILQFAI